jgi:DNA-binding transcriptional ArsR family regulator
MEEMMNAGQAVTALTALAHEYRLGVYRMLVEAGPDGLNAGTIASRLKMAPSSLSFHLRHLNHAGLVTQERSSRQLIYAADFAVMNDLVGYLTENCCAGSAAACGSGCEPARAQKRSAKKAARAA